jgi:carbon monoxide dehydrogenase subunit G
MKFTNTITIDRPPASVFAYLADFENVPAWNYAISETRKLTDGPVAVGARYRQSRTLPDPAEETFEVTEYEPDRALGIRGSLGPFPAQVSYTLEPAGNATVLTNTFDLEPSGALKLVAPIANRRIKSAVAANLGVLKQILEKS